MFSRVERFFESQFPLISFLALTIGLFADPVAKFFNPLIFYVLMSALYFNFVKMDFSVLAREIKAWPYQIYLTAYTLLALPILMHTVVRVLGFFIPLPADTALGALLFFAAPTAVIAPTLTLLLKGRFERALLNLFLTSLLVPLTLPFLVFILERSAVHLDYAHMTGKLTLMIFAPLALALLTKRLAPAFHSRLRSHAPFLAILFLAFLTIGGVYGVRNILVQNSHVVAVFLGMVVFLMIVSFTLSWFFSFKRENADRLTLAACATWTNVSLALVVANEFFRESRPLSILFIVASFFPWNLGFFPMKWVAARLMASENASGIPKTNTR
ncbi:MAG: bile acid:sodium symporter [Spirochaetia bacterium]|nr:bile acid:sodium symporter [Spirochaetia bacterium]